MKRAGLCGEALVLAACSSAAIASPVESAAAARANDFQLSGQQTQGGWLRGLAPAGTRSVQLDGVPVQVAPDGRFIIAFDRDAGPAATLTATLGNGRVVSRMLTVSPRA
jgi:hypothetical protein